MSQIELIDGGKKLTATVLSFMSAAEGVAVAYVQPFDAENRFDRTPTSLETVQLPLSYDDFKAQLKESDQTGVPPTFNVQLSY